MMKHTYKFTGNALYPVQNGYRAYLQSGDDLFSTSIVLGIIYEDAEKIIFETVNSIYEIIYDKALQLAV